MEANSVNLRIMEANSVNLRNMEANSVNLRNMEANSVNLRKLTADNILFEKNGSNCQSISGKQKASKLTIQESERIQLTSPRNFP